MLYEAWIRSWRWLSEDDVAAAHIVAHVVIDEPGDYEVELCVPKNWARSIRPGERVGLLVSRGREPSLLEGATWEMLRGLPEDVKRSPRLVDVFDEAEGGLAVSESTTQAIILRVRDLDRLHHLSHDGA